MTRLEQIFLAIGFALLAVWGTATIDSFVFSRAAIARFDAIKAAKAGSSMHVLEGQASRSEVGLVSWPIKRKASLWNFGQPGKSASTDLFSTVNKSNTKENEK